MTKLKAQSPAEGISVGGAYGNAIQYNIECTCGDPNHKHNVWVQAEDVGVTVEIYTTETTDFWRNAIPPRYDIQNVWLQKFDWFWKSIANSVIRKVQLTWKLWTKGLVEYQSNIIMTQQQALNYSAALKKAIEDVDQIRKKAD